jgi:DNA-binding protein HU-beta
VNKQDLISAVADESGLSKGDAGKAIDAMVEVVTRSLKKGEEVRLVGFGTFQVSDQKAREGRNPKTGEKIAIAASRQPKFKAGAEFKRAVNG